ncbi:hypothetical protein WG66_010343 [Moniliophthora roreri]|nr:hypothetical protein WG66_010343 [Moniliophthora roreri]
MTSPIDLDPASTQTPGTKRKPTILESWEKLLKEISRYDEETVKNWKEDIDTLLVFAGLFSAVVTAFTIESYKWLSGDPANMAFITLVHISQQISSPDMTSPVSLERTPFIADATSIRINSLWFLSLILSLTSGLFGLLCKQWLREHRSDPRTRTPGEALALRQLRRDSLDKWGLISFLSTLPILLEAALALFFVGLLDLLWTLHIIPFILSLIAVTLSLGLYLITTILPTLNIPRTPKLDMTFQDEVTYQYICPFKSPQSWTVYSLSCKLLRPLLSIPAIERIFTEWSLYYPFKHPTLDWSSFDLQVVDELGMTIDSNQSFNLNVYQLRALQFAVRMFKDDPMMTCHLENVLGTLPPSVVMSVVFGHWHLTMWEKTTALDIQHRLHDSRRFFESKSESCSYIHDAPPPSIPFPLHYSSSGIKLMFLHQYWMGLACRGEIDAICKSIKALRPGLERVTDRLFFIPFPLVDMMWTHSNLLVRKKSLALLQFFENAWTASAEDKHIRESLAFLQALARHLNRTDVRSELLIIHRRLYQHHSIWDKDKRRGLMSEWYSVTERVREIGSLDLDCFDSIPKALDVPPWQPFSVPAGRSVEIARTRYSIETIPDTQGNLEIQEDDGIAQVTREDIAMAQAARRNQQAQSHNAHEGNRDRLFTGARVDERV